jgi:hypothetical protein
LSRPQKSIFAKVAYFLICIHHLRSPNYLVASAAPTSELHICHVLIIICRKLKGCDNVTSKGRKFIPSLTKIGQLFQRLKWGTHKHRQHGNFTGLLIPSRKESMAKM